MKSLVSLQEMESKGQLPYTMEVDNGFRCNKCYNKIHANMFADIVANSPNPKELLDWFIEGEYMINYGLLGIKAAFKRNISLLELLRDYKTLKGVIIFCPAYVLYKSRKIMTREIVEWLEEEKKKIEMGAKNIFSSNNLDEWYSNMNCYYDPYYGMIFY